MLLLGLFSVLCVRKKGERQGVGERGRRQEICGFYCVDESTVKGSADPLLKGPDHFHLFLQFMSI